MDGMSSGGCGLPSPFLAGQPLEDSRRERGEGERECLPGESWHPSLCLPRVGRGAAPLVPSLMGDKLVSTAGDERHGQMKALGSSACFQGVVSGSRSGNDFCHRLIRFSSSSAE